MFHEHSIVFASLLALDCHYLMTIHETLLAWSFSHLRDGAEDYFLRFRRDDGTIFPNIVKMHLKTDLRKKSGVLLPAAAAESLERVVHVIGTLLAKGA